MKKPVITITTDFGDSFAASQLKAVVLKLGFRGDIIENHSVSSFSLTEGAFQILVLSKFTPSSTIHVGVVDPGVGGSRRGIVIKSKDSWYVGPDNGLLYPASTYHDIQKVWYLSEQKINPHVSNTFHGRDVFIIAATYLSQGLRPEKFHCVKALPERITQLHFSEGQVLHIDHYGNIKIFSSRQIVPGRKITIVHKKKKIEVLCVKTFSDIAPGYPCVLLGSSGFLELAVNLGSAAKIYNIGINDTLTVFQF